MERKNMVLLTVIAVATLLVAVVGATFAYFTATATTTNETEANVTTTKDLGGSTVTFAAGKELELLNYPGGLAVYGATATIKKTDMADEHDYKATFNLKIDYDNQTNTELDWTLYMVASEYSNLDAAQTTTCKLQQKQVGTEMQFWYADTSDDGSVNTTSCSGQAIIDKLTKSTEQQGLNATEIASGKLKSKHSGSITKNTEDSTEFTQKDGNLENREINTIDTTTKYYYLVIKYPNSGDQSDDAGQTISVTLSIDGDIQSSVYSKSA